MYRRYLAVLTLSISLALAVAAAPLTSASSHREAPLSAADPQNDATDLYAFVSPDAPDTVTPAEQLDPLPGARRRPQLLPMGGGDQLRHQHRQ